jgi:hypothetical protein
MKSWKRQRKESKWVKDGEGKKIFSVEFCALVLALNIRLSIDGVIEIGKFPRLAKPDVRMDINIQNVKLLTPCDCRSV